MRGVSKIFLRGLLAFLPVFLTIYAMIVLVRWLNTVCNQAMAWLFPELPALPGLGIALSIALILILGTIVSTRVTRWLFSAVELPLRSLPVVRELYASLKQLTRLFASDNQTKSGKVVTLRQPGSAASMIGIVLNQGAPPTPPDGDSNGTVAVYLPMSYQIGGFTVFVPADWLEEIDMPVESAMRHALTGWIDERT